MVLTVTYLGGINWWSNK